MKGLVQCEARWESQCSIECKDERVVGLGTLVLNVTLGCKSSVVSATITTSKALSRQLLNAPDF